MSETKQDTENVPMEVEEPSAPSASDIVNEAIDVPRKADGSPVERPVITKLELENFKSYAGLKTIGPMHHRFNSIIGPNGSGKSNVIDAMMFVFGKRAKKLRLKKVSELIHNSAEFPNFGYARVNVHFVNVVDVPGTDDVKPVPGTECVISRMAKKDNSSKYMLNGKNATFKAVAAELSKRNIDLNNNRFLILQGEVELISQMKPLGTKDGEVGLLEYLEDIIGSNQFVEPIKEASLKYDTAEETRTQAKNRMRAAEKTREGLRGSRDDVISFKNAQRSVATKRNILWHKKKIVRANESLRIQKQVTDMKIMRDEAALEFKEESDAVDLMATTIKTLKKEHVKLEKETDDWREKYAQFERKDVKMREDLIHSKAEKKKLSKITKKSIVVVQACKEQIQALMEDEPSRNEDVVEAKKALNEAEIQLEAVESTLKGKTDLLRSELKTVRAELKPLGKITDNAKNSQDECKDEIDLVKTRSSSARKTFEKLQKDLMEAENCVTNHSENVNKINVEIEQKTARNETAKKELVELNTSLTAIDIDIDGLRNAREDKQNELVLAQASVGGSRATGMLAALQSEEAGVGTDLLGRLGDLGGIDQKYDVAVSTAAGALNNLVTRTVDGAQKCIDYLRKHKLGRATFIVLEKIQYLNQPMNSYTADKTTQKEKCVRLFDLVQPRDDEVRVAFYYALRNTIVAKNLDQATKIAYDKKKCIHRVVSLKGELIELSGTMSGGGGKARSGLMKAECTARTNPEGSASAKEAEHKLKQIETDLKNIENNYRSLCKNRDELKKKRQYLEKEIRTLTTWLKKTNTKLSKMNASVKASADLIPDLTRNVTEIKSTVAMTNEEKSKIEELSLLLVEKEKEFKTASANTIGLENRVEELQKSIMNVGGNTLKRAKAVRKNFEKKLKEAEATITKTNVDIKALTKKIETSEKQSNVAEKAKEEMIATMQATIEAIKELDGHATECVETFNTVQASEQVAKEQVGVAETNYNVAAKALKSKTGKMNELEESMSELNEKYSRITHELSVWEEKITSLMTTFNEDDSLTANINDEDDSSASNGNNDGEGEDESKMNGEDDIEESNLFLLRTPTVKDLDEANMNELEISIDSLETKITTLRNEIDMSALEAYNKANADWNGRRKEFDTSTMTRDEARTSYEILRKKRLDTFMRGFGIITLKLKEMYQMITLGGDAELELVDTLDPFAEGIVFSVRPRGKSWKNIANLSGGEKTLSSLALVFALHHYKPTPLYVMDEIDAALDFRNVSIVANYIKERTRNAQFIIISLRNNMFELADRLVGIYKTNNSTKSVAINPKRIAAMAAAMGEKGEDGKDGKDGKAKKKSGNGVVNGEPLSVRNR